MLDAKQVKCTAPLWDIAKHYEYDFKKGYGNECPFCGKMKLAVNEQTIYCFQAGCTANSKGNDIFNLLVKTKKASSFKEALYSVKNVLGLKDNYNTHQIFFTRMDILKKAFMLYNRNLNSIAIEYLTTRNFNKSLWYVSIGYANSSNFLQDNGFSKEQLETAGLLSKAGGELFYNHIIFAFLDQNSRVVHLQGRNLGNSEARWINTRGESTKSITNYLFNINNATHLDIFLTEGVTDGLTLIESLSRDKVVSCVGVHPKLTNQLDYFKYKRSLTAIFDNDRFDFNNEYPGELKSWKGILVALFQLSYLLPDLEIYCIYPPNLPNIKDVNDWHKHQGIDINYITQQKLPLIDFTLKHYPNGELDGLIIKYILLNPDTKFKSKLNDKIKKYNTPLDYIINLMESHSIYLP